MANYNPKWNLNSIFEGGSESAQFRTYLDDLKEETGQLRLAVNNYQIPKSADEVALLVQLLEQAQSVMKKMRESGAFISCLSAQDVNDKKASLLRGEISQTRAAFATVLTTLDQKLIQISDDVWASLVTSEELQGLEFVLTERRQNAKEKLSLEQEALVNDLAVDGYHGWSQLYDTIVSRIRVPFEENGEVKQLSVGQAANKLSSFDRNVRKQVFENWEEAWANEADLLTDTLNHLGGFRLNLYKHRNWESVHKEPLSINRMSEDTLKAMWSAIEKYKPEFKKYLDRKAEYLGLDQLSWYDVGASVGSVEKQVPYDEGADFIVEQFEKFSPVMAAFAKEAFEKGWIEAEDRPGKRPGGFCTSFPDSKQTRIFMTYSGTAGNVSTLAHELGHAFHQRVMEELPPMNQNYAMNVAETASTFAEMIVSDAAVKNASNDEEKLALLEDKVNRSVAFYMNIHSRFLFETRFYEERKNGFVSTERLNELMVEAQKEAHLDSLKDYHPHFWGSKLHFYITGVPFYNFPYTFGYLFSLGIYAKALESGENFEDKYIALLEDTGRMQVEDLAKKHLDVDLEGPEFWENAVKLSVKDVEEFLKMTSKS